MFYPRDPHTLAETVNDLLTEAPGVDLHPKLMIVPHAGYVYSGPTAARAYRCLDPGQVNRVVLLGPAHTMPLRGMALPAVTAFATPLGDVELDMESISALAQHFDFVQIMNTAHVEEHSLEVQVPFIQVILNSFKIIPLVVGETRPEQVSAVLEYLWGGPETLILISSDLSHFLPYETANQVDAQTSRAIETLDSAALREDGACGYFGLRGLLRLARAKQLRVERLDLCNSGDTAGERGRVVGYGAWAFMETETNDES